MSMVAIGLSLKVLKKGIKKEQTSENTHYVDLSLGDGNFASVYILSNT